MANPQIEDGYTPIANEILEHLARLHLSPNHWRVLLCIIRKTYGYHKKVDYIANFQIVEATNLCKAVVSRGLNFLAEMGIIVRKGKFIGFQKDWESWQKLAISSTKVSNTANNPELAISSTLDTKLAESSTPEKLAISSTELAISSTKVSSCASTQKIKDTITKDITKLSSSAPAKISFEEYKESLREKYPELDHENEYQKFCLYWDEGVRKCKNRKLAWHNWLDKARGFKKQGVSYEHNFNGKKDDWRGLPGNRPAGAFKDIED